MTAVIRQQSDGARGPVHWTKEEWMPDDTTLPNEEATPEVVSTATRIEFGKDVTTDQCVRLHDLIMHGFRPRVFEVLAHNETGD